MLNKKPWQSKSIVFGALTSLAGLLAVFVPAFAPFQAFLASHVGQFGMLWGIMAVVLRLVTKNAISLEE